MSTSFRLAWRNIWRNPRRTLLTAGAIGFAAAILVFFISLQLTSYETSIKATLSIFQGSLQVQHEAFEKQPELRHVFPDTPNLRKALEGIPGIQAVAPRATAFALASSEKRTYGVQIVGVLPDRERSVSTIPGLVVDGRYLRTDSVQAEVVVGSALARNLQVELGDELTILGQARDGSLAAGVLSIVGIFQSGSQDLDRALIEIPLALFDEMFAMDGSVSAFIIRTDNVAEVPALQNHLQEILAQLHDGSLAVLRWDQLIPGLKQAIELDMASGWVFYAALVLLVSLGVLNTFLMSTLERTRELGILLALGAKPRRLFRLLILEGALLTGTGLTAGMTLGSLFVAYFGLYGFSLPGTEKILEHWNLPSRIYTRLSADAVLDGPLVILLFSLFAALYPALRVFRLNIPRAIGQR